MTWISKITLCDGNKPGKTENILDTVDSGRAGYFSYACASTLIATELPLQPRVRSEVHLTSPMSPWTHRQRHICMLAITAVSTHGTHGTHGTPS